MTAPTNDHDLLVQIATKMDVVLSSQTTLTADHATLRVDVAAIDKRVTVLETESRSEETQKARSYSGKTMLGTAAGSAAMAGSLLYGIISSIHGG